MSCALKSFTIGRGRKNVLGSSRRLCVPVGKRSARYFVISRNNEPAEDLSRDIVITLQYLLDAMELQGWHLHPESDPDNRANMIAAVRGQFSYTFRSIYLL